jgi:hypothetical protein
MYSWQAADIAEACDSTVEIRKSARLYSIGGGHSAAPEILPMLLLALLVGRQQFD